jgi:hypothetical protein
MTGIDPAGSATKKSDGRLSTDYTKDLKTDALKGARIGIARDFLRRSLCRLGDRSIRLKRCAKQARRSSTYGFRNGCSIRSLSFITLFA